MFHTIEEFTTEWKRESEATLKLMEAMTDDSLHQAITPEHRTLGQIAWHLVRMFGSISKPGYLEIEKPEGDERAPASANEIANEYKRMSQAFLRAVESQWTDDKLLESEDVHGEKWTNAFALRLVIQHEVHHRGQMLVLMRQAGLRPPMNLYGPNRDDWIDSGREPFI